MWNLPKINPINNIIGKKISIDKVGKNKEDGECEDCKHFDENEALFNNACKRSPNLGCKFERKYKR